MNKVLPLTKRLPVKKIVQKSHNEAYEWSLIALEHQKIIHAKKAT